jgi:hypothetical protein
VTLQVVLPLDQIVDARAERGRAARQPQVAAHVQVDRQRDVGVRAALGAQRRVADEPPHPGEQLEERRRARVTPGVGLERDVLTERRTSASRNTGMTRETGGSAGRLICSSGSRPVTTSRIASARAEGMMSRSRPASAASPRRRPRPRSAARRRRRASRRRR